MPPLPQNNGVQAPTNGNVLSILTPPQNNPLANMPVPPPVTPQPNLSVATPQNASIAPTPPPATQPSVAQPTTTQPPASAPTLADGTQLDPSVVAVMKAIASVETGGTMNYSAVGDNGASMGAFQWNNGGTPVAQGQTPVNWQNAAAKFLGDPNAPMTPANQNYVAYHQILAYKNQGLTPNSIDALWNGAKPDPNNPGQFIHISSQRAQQFTTALQNVVSGQPIIPTPQTPSPSIQGFLGNVIGSGASFLGNVGSALLHPINTIQNLASVPVGALQELGGESTPQTAIFDAVKNNFAQRYGSPQDIAHTLYTDPVGVLADLSAVAGGAGLVAGTAGKLADVAKLGDLATAGDAAARAGVDFTVGADGVAIPSVSATEGTGVAGAAQQVSQTLNKISHITNPLAPVVNGSVALASKGEGFVAKLADQFLGINANDVRTIQTYPDSFTEEEMAKVSRAGLAQEVAGAYKERLASLSDTSAEYNPIRQDTTPINVSPTFLEDQFRKTAKVNIVDGQISANADSIARSPAEISKLQQTYDFWKPTFQSGEMTPNQFMNFRQDVGSNLARFEGSPIKNQTLANIGKQIYHDANEEYRPQIPNLEKIDASYSAQRTELQNIGKGLFDRNGELTSQAINRIANAAGKGKDADLARLEQLFPGITGRIQILRTVENLQSVLGPKVGTYGRSIFGAVRLGSYALGIATGNTRVLAGALAIEAIQDPTIAVKLITAISKVKPEVVRPVLADLTRYVVMGSSSLNTSTQQPTATQQSPASGQFQVGQVPSSSDSQGVNILPSGQQSSLAPGVSPNTQEASIPSVPSPQTSTVPPELQALAVQKGMSAQYVQQALDAGYSPQEIANYLND